jgi:hypothetical protein
LLKTPDVALDFLGHAKQRLNGLIVGDGFGEMAPERGPE